MNVLYMRSKTALTANIIIKAYLGWIGYITKKSGFITAAAIVNIFATVAAPYIFPITIASCIFGFIGAKKQKQLNSADKAKAIKQC